MQNTPANQPPVNKTSVTLGEINNSWADGETPVDFIKKNIRSVQPQQVPPQPPQGQQPPLPPSQMAPSTEPFQTFADPSLDVIAREIMDQETPVAPAPTSAPEPQPPAEPVSEDVQPPKPTKEDSLRAMRKKLNEGVARASELQQKIDELTKEVTKWQTGEAIPDVLKEKNERISQLERFEKLHSLKTSPEYSKKFLDPLDGLKNKAEKLAEAYQVDPNILNEALTIENRRDLNTFLRTYFDETGTTEVRGVLDEIKAIGAAMEEAEVEPALELERLREESQRQQVANEQTRLAGIKNAAQSEWTTALRELRDKGEFPEFELTGDADNDAISRPILTNAAQEYGKFIKYLGLQGLKELPPDIAKALAKRFLLSQAASIMGRSRMEHYNRAEALIAENKKQSNILYPPVGSGVSSGGRPQAPQPQSPEEAADVILKQIGVTS